jgi:Ca-activated chloride channel family protein
MRSLAGLLWMTGLLCLVLIAAGLRNGVAVPTTEPQPEALVIVLDVSSSMTAEDFAPGNRLEVAKHLLTGFVTSHANADLGLILLAASPRLVVPVTRENLALVRALKEVRPAGFGEDGTAIGSGIASAVNRLRQGLWSKRSILLVTDGVNNRGALAPSDAAHLAARMGIRIDTVGIGTNLVSRYWVPSSEGSPLEVKARIQIDDQALEEVSNITGGNYRRVTNADELERALKSLRIGSPTSITTVTAHYDDTWRRMAALAALLLICAEFVLTRFISPELPG